jgi:DNA-binding transcriptional ArsR family regulator
MDALDFLKVLLDPDRLAVVGLVAAGPRAVEEIGAATGQRERDVLATLGPLVQAGIVVREGARYALVRASLRELARDLPQPSPPARQVFFGMTQEEQAVLGRFFRGDRLVEIPTRRQRRGPDASSCWRPRPLGASAGWSWSASPWTSSRGCTIRSRR